MLLEIDHHSGVPIYRQIVDQIRSQVIAGQLTQGRQLLSVRDLAGKLRVNPMTVSKAYARLELEGLVHRRRGVGLFVSELDRRQKETTRLQIMEELLEKVAVTAVQLDIDMDDIVQRLDGFYKTYNGKKVGKQ